MSPCGRYFYVWRYHGHFKCIRVASKNMVRNIMLAQHLIHWLNSGNRTLRKTVHVYAAMANFFKMKGSTGADHFCQLNPALSSIFNKFVAPQKSRM